MNINIVNIDYIIWVNRMDYWLLRNYSFSKRQKTKKRKRNNINRMGVGHGPGSKLRTNDVPRSPTR